VRLGYFLVFLLLAHLFSFPVFQYTDICACNYPPPAPSRTREGALLLLLPITPPKAV
jgi:hypothetical protein